MEKSNKQKKQIETLSNIGLENIRNLKKWLPKDSFEKIIESFWDTKVESTNNFSRVLSQNKTKVSKLNNIKIDINNIINQKNRTNLNKNIQFIISNIYLQEIRDKWKSNPNFVEMFQSHFWDIEKIISNEKKLYFKDLSLKIEELLKKFPWIIKWVKVANSQIFKKLNIDFWLEFNQINPFYQKILCELLYREYRDDIEKYKFMEKSTIENLEKLYQFKLSPSNVFEWKLEIKNENIKQEIENLNLKKEEIVDSKPESYEKLEKINTDIRKKYLLHFKDIWIDESFIKVLENLLQNSFDFSKLSDDQKNVLLKNLNQKNLLNIEKNKRIKSLSLDKQDYQNFINELLDFTKTEQEIVLPVINWSEIKLKIKKKFVPWENKKFLDFENFKNIKDLPIEFDVNLDGNDKEAIAALENEKNAILSSKTNYNWIINSYQTKNWILRLWNNYKIKLNWVDLDVNKLDDLFGLDKEKLQKKLEDFWIREATKKDFEKIVNDKKLMNSIENSNNWNSVFEEMLKNIDVDVTSRNLKFQWSEIEKINHLYLTWNSEKEDFKDLESEDQPQVEDLVSNINQSSNKWSKLAKKLFQDILDEYENWDLDDFYYTDSYEEYSNLDENEKSYFEDSLRNLALENWDEELQDFVENLIENFHIEDQQKQKDNIVNQKQEIETEGEKFLKSRWDLKWNPFEWEKDKWFRIWTRIFINIWWSLLPPKDKTDSFFEFEIVAIKDNSFQVKAMGNELKNEGKWKTYRVPKTEEQLGKITSWWDVYKVAKWYQNDRDKCLENINKSKFFDKINSFWNSDGQVTMKWWSFVNNQGEEIKYFNRVSDDYTKDGQTKVLTKYEIKWINKSKWTVKLKCVFWDNDPENPGKQKNYKYENEISFEQFILLVEWKQLRGYTQDQQKQVDSEHKVAWWWRSPNRWTWKFYSIASIIDSFKNWFKKIKENIKKYEDEQQEDFENFLYSREWLNLYWKVWSVFSLFGMIPTIEDAFDTAQLEFYNEREWRTWKKIEKRYKMFEWDPHFATLYFDQLQPLLTSKWYMWKSKHRHKFAAAFLILMKKDGPNKWEFMKYIWKWHRIEKILWPEHKKRFQLIYAQKKRELEEYKNMWYPSWWRLDRQNQLNKMEFEYIIQIIDWRQPFSSSFWEENKIRESRWLPKLENDEHYQASIWSRTFVSKLEENINEYFGWFEKWCESASNASFHFAEQEYVRNLTWWKPQKALPFLNRMLEAAQSPSEQFRAKWFFLSAMLSWVLKNYQDSSVMKKFWASSRSMWFLPWLWARDTDQQDKVQKLLDAISKNSKWTNQEIQEFTKTTWYKKSDFEPWSFSESQVKMGFVSKTFPDYRQKNWNKILDILEMKDNSSQNSIVSLSQKDSLDGDIFKELLEFSREKYVDSTNDKISPAYGENSPWTANKWIVNNYVPRQWEYKWRNADEIQAAQDFWKSVKKTFNTSKRSNKEEVSIYLWKFSNRFDDYIWDQSTLKFLIRWFSLVKKLKQKWYDEEAKYNLRYLIKWNIHEKLWSFPGEFWWVVDKFLEFFTNNIELIDDKMIKNIFWDEAVVNFDDPYGMLPWSEFRDNYMSFEWLWWGSKKNKYMKENRSNSDNYINRNIENISKNMKRKWISIPVMPPQWSSLKVEHPSEKQLKWHWKNQYLEY